jgi:hypothetical protein
MKGVKQMADYFNEMSNEQAIKELAKLGVIFTK